VAAGRNRTPHRPASGQRTASAAGGRAVACYRCGMFGLGMGEILIILVLALILLGPQKLPEAAKQLGKGLRDFRKATEDLKSQFEREMYAPDQKPARPTLVEPTAGDAAAAGAEKAGGSAGAGGDGPIPAASAENVPGLEAALAEAPPAPQAPPGTPPRSA